MYAAGPASGGVTVQEDTASIHYSEVRWLCSQQSQAVSIANHTRLPIQKNIITTPYSTIEVLCSQRANQFRLWITYSMSKLLEQGRAVVTKEIPQSRRARESIRSGRL